MNLEIGRSGGKVIFDFGSEPVALSRLRVLDPSGATMWDLIPLHFAPTPVKATGGSFVRLPEDTAAEVLDALRLGIQDLDSGGGQAGEDVLGKLSSAITARQQGGELSDKTAAAALQALRELGHAGKSVAGVSGPFDSRGEPCRRSGGGTNSVRVRMVFYGELPEGYRQLQEPRTLVKGEAYSVVVLGVEAFDLGQKSFVA